MCLPKGEGKCDFLIIKTDMLDLNLESFIDPEETQECYRIYGLSKTLDHWPSPLMQVLSFVLPTARLIVSLLPVFWLVVEVIQFPHDVLCFIDRKYVKYNKTLFYLNADIPM